MAAAAQAIDVERPLGDAARDVKPPELAWKTVQELECELTVDLAVPDFKIGDLLRLREGLVINTRWRLDRDVPLQLNRTLIGWVEFDVAGHNLAVRLTELA
jgi:flagellar motor switch/type III secretory pathway protein FliN